MKIAIFVALGALSCAGIGAGAAAAGPARAAMSCKEFLSFDELTRPKVVYWAEGVNRKGRPEDAVVDVAQTERLIPIVTEECRHSPRASFWSKVEASWARAKSDVARHL